MSTRSEKRKAAATEESAKKPTLKIPEKTNIVCVYENQSGREKLEAVIPAWKAACNKFLADTVVTHVRVDRAGVEKMAKEYSAKSILAIKISFPGEAKCVFTVGSGGDGGWHDTRIVQAFTPAIDFGALTGTRPENASECNEYIKDALYERFEFAARSAEAKIPDKLFNVCNGGSEEADEDVAVLLHKKCTGHFAGLLERAAYARKNPRY